ncbi:MAG: asparagine synthase (glutamine-hydrolyzing) [Sphingobacteriales bacterium]|nr:MAG: asparagine synthase (glutamine-hydrolyzing) [Sphingobacteriales bacterium]
MCGITGLFLFKQQEAHRLQYIGEATERLILRGPDSGSTFTDHQTALGHRRLSILDTSSCGSQPMEDASGRYVLVFNGEIFNFEALSKQYLHDTWSRIGGPKSHSDTEVLLYLLIQYGTACLPWLSGFFAFALYDKTEKTLLLARDRYGKKPLLYHRTDAYCAFASEMKSLLAWGVPRKLDATVLYQYLQLNYVAQPWSMIEGVRKLAPGHWMKLDSDGSGTEQPWYELHTAPEQYNQYTYEDAQKVLVEKMDAAVQQRLISDVPLGAFLSGGIDSSVVVALASRHTKNLSTFSIGYKNNPFFDETAYAKLVADKYQTNHTVFSLSNDDFLEHLYGVLDYLDEPFADSSALPVYILCKNTRQHVTVALSGDGGDEVFAGYNKHGAEYRIRQQSLKNTVAKMGAPLWKMLPKSRNSKLTNTFRQLHRFAEGARLGTAERYWRWASLAGPEQVKNLLSKSTRQQLDTAFFGQIKAGALAPIQTDDYNEILLTDMSLVLQSDMLVKVDLMSMANSLEVRSPFLDHDVVDFAFGLPAEYKISGTLKKRIVQDAFRKLLPEEIYNRPKQGFEIPLLGWFRNELWPLINEDLLSHRFVSEQGIFDPQAIEALKAKMRSSNPEDSHATIWALIVFQYWWKKYLAV